MKARSIYEQTGWKRSTPVSLCQEIKILEKITEFDFDLNSQEFKDYIRARVGWNLKPIGMTHEAFIEFLMDGDEVDVRAMLKEKTEVEFKSNIRHLQIMRATIQDCWEIYNETECF